MWLYNHQFGPQILDEPYGTVLLGGTTRFWAQFGQREREKERNTPHTQGPKGRTYFVLLFFQEWGLFLNSNLPTDDETAATNYLRCPKDAIGQSNTHIVQYPWQAGESRYPEHGSPD
jgi:hypothetical protein